MIHFQILFIVSIEQLKFQLLVSCYFLRFHKFHVTGFTNLIFMLAPSCRLLRYWIAGDKVGDTELLAMLPGYPDNVRVNMAGDVWVAMHCRRNVINMLSGAFPTLRRAFLQLPIPFKYLYRIFNGKPHGILAKYSFNHVSTTTNVYSHGSAHMTLLLEDTHGSVVKYASEVDERDGHLWIGSVLLPYIAVYDLHTTHSNPPLT